MSNSVSLYDVAERAGVSHMTVSNVLNRPGLERLVAADTAARVRAAARQLGYTPNRIARCLASGKTHEIILATPMGLVHPHVNELVEQIHLALGGHGYHLNLELLYHLADEESVYRTFVAARCDGVIALGLLKPAREALIEKQRAEMPVVVIDVCEDRQFDYVHFDHVESVRLGVAHLLQQGHRHVALVYDALPCAPMALRLRGYQTALRDAGVSFDHRLLFPWSVEDESAALWKRLAATVPRPTAIFVYNDELAVGLEHAIRLAGLRVPHDVALVTQNNSRVLRLAEVPLSVVDVNHRGIAAVVVERMLARIANPRLARRQILVKPSLLVRQSSARI